MLKVRTKSGQNATWHADNFWFYPRTPLDALIREICEQDDPDRIHVLLSKWEELDGAVDINECTKKAIECPKKSYSTAFIDLFERTTGPSTTRLLRDEDEDFSDANEAGGDTEDVDLSSRLWELGDTDAAVQGMRRDVTVRNAPAAIWAAGREDDHVKLDELHRFGAEMTQGYLTSVPSDDSDKFKAVIVKNLEDSKKALKTAEDQAEDTLQSGALQDYQEAMKKVDQEKERLKGFKEAEETFMK